MTTSGLPQTTPARLPDQEVWEDTARASLLSSLPLRASLIGLIGAGLSATGGSPVNAAVSISGGVCTVTNEADLREAMETSTAVCASVTLAETATITAPFMVQKDLTLEDVLYLQDDFSVGAGISVIIDTSTSASGQLVVRSADVSISGTDSATSVIRRGTNVATSLLFIGDTSTVEISNLTFDGDATGTRGAIEAIDSHVSVASSRFVNNRAYVGAAIYSAEDAGTVSSLDVNGSIFDSNILLFPGVNIRPGGAIYANSADSVTIHGSRFSSNQATHGGAAFIRSSGSVSITDSSVEDNWAYTSGGGVYVLDAETATIAGSLIANNLSALIGGGVVLRGVDAADVSNVTIVGNTSNTGGGGISASGSALSLRHVTVAFNSAGEGGGLYAASDSTIELSHSLLAGNTVSYGEGADLRSRSTVSDSVTVSYSILSSPPSRVLNLQVTEDANGPSAGAWFQADSATVFSANSLANNGGLTKTLALAGSESNPAINSGDSSFVSGQNGVPAFDQRGTGFARIQGGRIDIGAYESGIALSGSDSGNETPAPRPVEPLLPSVIPSLAISDATLTCTIGEFSDAPEFVDVTLVVGGVRQETRRIAMPATTVTWPVDSLWRGQSVGCEVVARVENRVATAYAPGISIPSAATPTPTPTPTPTTPAPTTPAEPARGFAAASIRFSPLSSALDAADRRAIASLVEQAGADATFRVTGYVQAVGSTRNDRALSRARAQAVAAELRRLGVAASNITAIGGGRSQRDGAAARRATITARWTR